MDLDGARSCVSSLRRGRGVASGMDRALLRDLQRRCLNFSLEVHAEEMPEGRDSGPVSAVFGPLEDEFAEFVKARRERGELEESSPRSSWRRDAAISHGRRARKVLREPGAALHRELQAAPGACGAAAAGGGHRGRRAQRLGQVHPLREHTVGLLRVEGAAGRPLRTS